MTETEVLIARRERLLSNGKNLENSGLINKINRKIRRLEKENKQQYQNFSVSYAARGRKVDPDTRKLGCQSLNNLLC